MNTFSIHCAVNAATANAADIEKAFASFCAANGYTLVREEFAPYCFERTNFLIGDVIYEIWENQGEDGPGIIDICRSESERDYKLAELYHSAPKSRWVKQKIVDAAWL